MLSSPARARQADRLIALGIWAVVASVYIGTASGRLDMIDAQFKFEVTASLIEHGDPMLRDGALLAIMGNPERRYAMYPLGPSLAGWPLARLGYVLRPENRELAQFLWSLTPAWMGAIVPAALYLAWRALGLTVKRALAWAAVVAFGTLVWTSATSSFDQAPQAGLLLVSVLLAHRSFRAHRPWLAAAGGAVLSLLLHYQPAFVLLGVPLGLILIPRRRLAGLLTSLKLPIAFSLGMLPGFIALLAYNVYRFGSPWRITPITEPLFDNPLLGALVLTISPGKGILFYSPVLLLALIGWRDLYRQDARLLAWVSAVSVVHFCLISSLACSAGEWCWGPRYLVVTLPLVALALPYGARSIANHWKLLLIAESVGVQVLGLTLDHQRFFFERSLQPHFWLHNHAFYFRDSQLIARVAELRAATPASFRFFSSGYSPLLTYAPFGPPYRANPPVWVRQFAVFYWPRPWPLWVSRLSKEDRFVDPVTGSLLLVALDAVGALLILVGARRHKCACPASMRAA